MMYMSDRQLQRFLKDEAKKAKATAAKRTNETNDTEGADSKRQKTVVTKAKKAPSKKSGDIEADIMDALEDSNVLEHTEPVKPSKGWKKGVGRKHKEGSVVKPESSRDESSMFGGDDGSTYSEEVRERKKGGKKGVRVCIV
jgi:chromatin remodeling complex protein RSC6